jgi:geranylgeranyl reductase family protein
MKIAIVGAGPAGCRAAALLAEEGHEVRLFDSNGPWEKPCGGGLTSRALDLEGAIGAQVPRQRIEQITVQYGDAPEVCLTPPGPLAVVSRKELGERLLDAAVSAGTTFVRTRVKQIERRGSEWHLETTQPETQSGFAPNLLIGADGATSLIRRQVSRPLDGDDLSVTLGYHVRGGMGSHMKIFFVPGLEGYIWSFPRPDHVSYGLITRPGPNWSSRGKALLKNYIVADLGPEVMEDAHFYSAHVPRLRPGAWARNPVHGDGWALLGDAAGLVDPITGEGIYYALRSAELLTQCLPDLGAYSNRVRTECMDDLERASRLYDRFYSGRFLGRSFRQRMVQLARRSPTIRACLGDLIAGRQGYRGLRRKLLWSAPRVGFETLMGVTAPPVTAPPETPHTPGAPG